MQILSSFLWTCSKVTCSLSNVKAIDGICFDLQGLKVGVEFNTRTCAAEYSWQKTKTKKTPPQLLSWKQMNKKEQPTTWTHEMSDECWKLENRINKHSYVDGLWMKNWMISKL